MKRFITFIMCITLICSVGGFFVSCEKEAPEESLQQTEAQTDAEAEKVYITLSALKDYVIVRNDEGYLYQASAKQLKESIKESFSLDVKVKSDFVTSAMPGYEEAEFEILVGPCDREESVSFVSGLKKNDYGYAVVGSKLVISGATEEGTRKAYEHFLENVVRKCDGEIFFDNGSQSFIFRDESVPMIAGKNVLILTSSVATGRTTSVAMDAVKYYGGTVSGLASIYSAVNECCGVPVYSVFDANDLDGYYCVPPHECPLCKEGKNIDGVVTSYGFSGNNA